MPVLIGENDDVLYGQYLFLIAKESNLQVPFVTLEEVRKIDNLFDDKGELEDQPWDHLNDELHQWLHEKKSPIEYGLIYDVMTGITREKDKKRTKFHKEFYDQLVHDHDMDFFFDEDSYMFFCEKSHGMIEHWYRFRNEDFPSDLFCFFSLNLLFEISGATDLFLPKATKLFTLVERILQYHLREPKVKTLEELLLDLADTGAYGSKQEVLKAFSSGTIKFKETSLDRLV